MKDETIHRVIEILRKEVAALREPAVTQVSRQRDPFKILISCIISLRTKDEVTRESSLRLFEAADNPDKMSGLTEKRIEKLIYPAGFYRVKAKNIREISRRIANDYHGSVPDEIDGSDRDEISTTIEQFLDGVNRFNPEGASQVMLIPDELGIPEVERMVWEIGALQGEDIQFAFDRIGAAEVIEDEDGPAFVRAVAVTSHGQREIELVRRDGRWLSCGV